MSFKDFINKKVETVKTTVKTTVIPTISAPISKTVEKVVPTKKTKSASSSRHKDGSIAEGVLEGIASTSLIGRVVVSTYEAKKKVDDINDAKKEINESIARAKRLNNIVQEDLDKYGKLKTEILSSFSTFCDCMEMFQERPEIKKLKCNDVSLPPFTLKELEISSLDAKMIISEVANNRLSWGRIAMSSNVAGLSSIALSALPVFSISLVASGLFFNKKSTDDEIWNEIEKNKKTINVIISRLLDLDETVLNFCDSLNKVYGYYNSKIEHVEEIIARHSKSGGKIPWSRLNNQEKLTIENCTLFVGLLYEMCKVQIVHIDKNKEQVIINHAGKNKIIAKAETIISTAA